MSALRLHHSFFDGEINFGGREPGDVSVVKAERINSFSLYTRT
jgi:hypothetical protein